MIIDFASSRSYVFDCLIDFFVIFGSKDAIIDVYNKAERAMIVEAFISK